MQTMKSPLNRSEFEAMLRERGRGYHINHPFHLLMSEGKLSKAQLQCWVANRFYYQLAIPVKDAAILSNCPDPAFRRQWIQRIIDHDGSPSTDGIDGGIEAWLMLGEAVGLSRNDLLSLKYLVPGAKFAVDAYINFARQQPWQEAVASSLTELFAPHIHQQRIDTWPEKYPWVDASGLLYFKNRLSQAKRDVQHGLDITLDYFGQSAEMQARACHILQFKLNVLWSLADAIMLECCDLSLDGELYQRKENLRH